MKYLYFPFFFFIMLLTACSSEEATQQERVHAEFLDSLGGNVSPQQWWRTSVTLKINVTTDEPVRLWLLTTQNYRTLLCDYKELSNSGSVTMTAPQGQGTTLYLSYEYKNKVMTQNITLSGKAEEFVTLNTTKGSGTRADNPPASLCGSSIRGNAQYYQFSDEQMQDFYILMGQDEEKLDAKMIAGNNCNYELESRGPFYITWVTGNEGSQTSRILGYYVHSPYTYEGIQYVDLSETHRWDYIDGMAKVQYQLSIEDEVDGHVFKPNTWYDANFDMADVYGATSCNNPDRLGDNAYNAQAAYYRYGHYFSALRGLTFEVDVPKGMRVGFYLRSDGEKAYPEQWDILYERGMKPYTANRNNFKGTCFCAEFLNIEGNGRGRHRSFIKDCERVYWMGMEDLVEGGDHDCNDVIFGVESDLLITMPEIVDPDLEEDPNKPNPDNPDPDNPDPDNPNPDNPNPDDPNKPNPDDPDNPDDPSPYDPTAEDFDPFPWTIAYEDVNRDPDFDFNDAVIKVVPDYENERCCITVLAAGSPTRMYLHYDGPDGDQNLGEVHDLMGSKQTYINTKGALAGTPFVTIDCVPWPKGYTMADDAQRFYIEIQRGTCDDCTDVITLAQEPGRMPEALLVAGEWQWPMEGTHIFTSYDEFSGWAKDTSRTRFWEWYKSPNLNSYVSY